MILMGKYKIVIILISKQMIILISDHQIMKSQNTIFLLGLAEHTSQRFCQDGGGEWIVI